ncbi:MAG: neutral/alkaline non-lysosomal ceramidase N-terminal domain-containing protein [Anaerolineae bacterium]
MGALRAGFGRVDVTPRLGCRLMGYSNRQGVATGVHDPLLARALVLEAGGDRYALVACELLYASGPTTAAVRDAVERRLGIRHDHVFVAAIHTHSGPDDKDLGNWERPLGDLITDAVAAAVANLRPARIGSGFGVLHGHSINRRWLDRPVDPAVGIIRVDALDGTPLGLVCNFACHGVVMGADNLLISADWPGQACRDLEAAGFGECLYFQGGCGDVNPLVAGVRSHLESGHTVVAIGDIGAWYGERDDPVAWNIGDRGGGTFAEVAELAAAFAAEAGRVARGIRCGDDGGIWAKRLEVDAARSPDEPLMPLRQGVQPAPLFDENGRIPSEVMLLRIGGILIVGQPGEVFSETSVRLRISLRLLGYHTPLLVSYANGAIGYLPEPEAFDEGGYEPLSPTVRGVSRYYQQRAWQAVRAAI